VQRTKKNERNTERKNGRKKGNKTKREGRKKEKIPSERLYQSYKPSAAKRIIELGHQIESQEK